MNSCKYSHAIGKVTHTLLSGIRKDSVSLFCSEQTGSSLGQDKAEAGPAVIAEPGATIIAEPGATTVAEPGATIIA